MKPSILVVLPLTAAVLCSACATTKPAVKDETPVLIGTVARDHLEAALPDWVRAQIEAHFDREAAAALAMVEPGAEVTVFLGTWCGDSRREVPRFWRVLDETGGLVPFTIRYIGVSRDKKEPAELVTAHDIRYVPTFIVTRDGREVGRIVESPPHDVESDLLDLLSGRAQGLLTKRQDLKTGAPAAPPGR
jgi:thiol-disulfide isomerase/thioredoxin